MLDTLCVPACLSPSLPISVSHCLSLCTCLLLCLPPPPTHPPTHNSVTCWAFRESFPGRRWSSRRQVFSGWATADGGSAERSLGSVWTACAADAVCCSTPRSAHFAQSPCKYSTIELLICQQSVLFEHGHPECMEWHNITADLSGVCSVFNTNHLECTTWHVMPGGFSLACEDFMRMFDNSFPAYTFFLFLFFQSGN